MDLRKKFYIFASLKYFNIMIDKTLFEAIMTLPSQETTMLLNSISILRKYSNLDLKADDKGLVCYEVSIEELLNSDITEEELKLIRNASWEIKDDKLVKFM